MKKISPTFHCITLMLICQVILAPVASVSVYATELTDVQLLTISENCSAIKESLVNTQRTDARSRVYLGRYYETILTDFITPLNLWLVSSNIPNTKLIENQSSFAERRTKFSNDYIAYQQGLEELTGTDCAVAPEKFYTRLETVREQRARVRRDVQALRGLVVDQMDLVRDLRAALTFKEAAGGAEE